MHERFYSTAELARICGVSISTIKRWTDAGLLRCVRTPGGHRKFRLQDVAEAARRFEASMAPPEARPAAQYDALTLLLLQQRHESLATRIGETLALGDAAGSRGWLVDLHRHGMPVHTLAAGVLWAALKHVDISRNDDYVSLRARALARSACQHLAAQFPLAGPASPKALLAQRHGASDPLWRTFALLVLREAGWEGVDLGAAVPWETLRHGAALERPRLVVLVSDGKTATRHDALQRELQQDGFAFWLLQESQESLAGLAATLHTSRQASKPKAPLQAAAPGSEEIFSLSRRLS